MPWCLHFYFVVHHAFSLYCVDLLNWCSFYSDMKLELTFDNLSWLRNNANWCNQYFCTVEVYTEVLMLQPVKESWLNLGIEAMKEKLLSALNSFTVVSAIYVYQYFIIHIPKSCRQLSADVITYKNLIHVIASLYCQHLEGRVQSRL